MTRIYVKFFDNEGNIVTLPVSSEDPVPPVGFKPAETWKQAWKRVDSRSKKLIGSVRLV